MSDLTEFENGKLLELVWQEHQSLKQLNCLAFRELPYQGLRRNSRRTEKPATGVISAGLPTVSAETDVH